MVATDPVFWCLQPSSPFEEHVSQLRILFQPEGVMFMMDRSFQTDEVIAKVKSELASEQLNEGLLFRLRSRYSATFSSLSS